MAAQGGEYPPPPSYEEAMKCTTFAPTAPPESGVVPPQMTPLPENPSTFSGVSSMPPSVSNYGSLETQPLSVSLPVGAQAAAPPQTVVYGNRCPACQLGSIEEGYTCLGLFCAIAFFPIGILCCLAMITKRCSNCDTEF